MRQTELIYILVATLVFPGQGSAQQVSMPQTSWDWSVTPRAASSTMSDAMPLRIGHTLPMRVSWTRTDIALASGFAAALLMDAGQTRGLARGGWDGFHETNPLLGRTPSVGRINVYTAVAGLTVLGAAAALPARLRPWFLGAAFVLEAFTVGRNAQSGIPIRFP